MHERRARFLSLLGVLALLPALQGCLRTPSLDPLRHDIAEQLGDARFERDVKLTFGAVSLGLLRTLARLVPDGEVQQARRLLSNVQRVELAVYRIHAASVPDGGVRTPRPLQKLLDGGRWQQAVRVKDGDERVWILYRERGGAVRDVYVATLDSKELVLVRVAGNMNRLLAWALEQHGGKVFRPRGEPIPLQQASGATAGPRHGAREGLQL